MNSVIYTSIYKLLKSKRSSPVNVSSGLSFYRKINALATEMGADARWRDGQLLLRK